MKANILVGLAALLLVGTLSGVPEVLMIAKRIGVSTMSADVCVYGRDACSHCGGGCRKV